VTAGIKGYKVINRFPTEVRTRERTQGIRWSIV